MRATLCPDASLMLEGGDEVRYIHPVNPAYVPLLQLYHDQFIDRDRLRLDEEIVEPKYPPNFGGHPWREGAPVIGQTYSIPLEDLHVDPERFQYKRDTDSETGIIPRPDRARFDAAQCGELAVWKSWRDGNTYVVDGHRRRELADRAHVDAVPCKYINARSIKDARAMARTLNGASPEPPKVFVPTPREADGWVIKPHGDGFGLFRSGRDTPVAVGKIHAEVADQIAGPRPKAPTIAEPDPGTVQLSAAEHEADVVERKILQAEVVRLSAAHVEERRAMDREAVRLQTLKADVTKMLRDRFPLSDYTAMAR